MELNNSLRADTILMLDCHSEAMAEAMQFVTSQTAENQNGISNESALV